MLSAFCCGHDPRLHDRLTPATLAGSMEARNVSSRSTSKYHALVQRLVAMDAFYQSSLVQATFLDFLDVAIDDPLLKRRI